jgi:hypothetical protein
MFSERHILHLWIRHFVQIHAFFPLFLSASTQHIMITPVSPTKSWTLSDNRVERLHVSRRQNKKLSTNYDKGQEISYMFDEVVPQGVGGSRVDLHGELLKHVGVLNVRLKSTVVLVPPFCVGDQSEQLLPSLISLSA